MFRNNSNLEESIYKLVRLRDGTTEKLVGVIMDMSDGRRCNVDRRKSSAAETVRFVLAVDGLLEFLVLRIGCP
jgi:hypothetical protein